MLRNKLTYLLVIFLLSACSEDEPNYPPPTPPSAEVVGTAKLWVTNGSQSKLLNQENDVNIVAGTETSNPSITISFSEKLQEIDGFGAALTGSSAYLINKTLNSTQRTALLKDLFDPQNGIGISYLRLTIGASDFSLSNYTYNDMPDGETDSDLTKFSIEADKEDIVPVLKSILAVSPSVKMMGSPWSAPAWMKTSGKLGGGSLKPEWYGTYANYFVKYINAYKAEGISIDAITIQNEPLHETSGYPTMKMEATEQTSFIKNNLGPLFEQEQVKTKIIAYDHNFDRSDYPLAVLNDSEAKKYVTGSAFHAYGGNVTAMSQVRNAHPDKGLYFTEVSGGEWATNFQENLKWNMSNIFIGTTNNWSKVVLLWNLALDSNHGPKNGGCQDCRGVVTISSSGNVTKNVEYYTIGHMSKFVRPGASRVKSTNFASSTNLESVAFLNTDGSKVLVILNSSSDARTFSVIDGEKRIDYTIEGNAVATLTWN